MLAHNSLLEKRDKLPKNKIQTAKFDKHQQTLDLIAEYQSPETLPHQKECIANQIFAINEGLCRKAANRYTYPGVDVEELVHLGRTGMERAIAEFDLSLGNQFSTYAMPWIRQQIRLSVQHDNTIYVPDSAHRVNIKGQKLIAQKITDTQQIAEILGKDVRYVQDCLDMCRRVKQIPVTPEGDEILFSDSVMISGSDRFDFDSLNNSQKIVRQALAKLKPTIQEIVLKRLDGWKFKEIAEFHQLASAKVQSIYKKVMAWIKGLLSPDQPEPAVAVQAESTQSKPPALTVEDHEPTETCTDTASSKDSEPVVTVQPAKLPRANRWTIFTKLLGRIKDWAALKSKGDRPPTNLFSSARNSTLSFFQSLQNSKAGCLDTKQIVRNKLNAAFTEQSPQSTVTNIVDPLNCQVILGNLRQTFESRFEFGLRSRRSLSRFIDRTTDQFNGQTCGPTFRDFLAASTRFSGNIPHLANASVVTALSRLKFVSRQAHHRRMLAQLLQNSNRVSVRFRVVNNIRSFNRRRCSVFPERHFESVNTT